MLCTWPDLLGLWRLLLSSLSMEALLGILHVLLVQCKAFRYNCGELQSPADVMEYSVVSEVLDADYGAAGTCSEDLHVHAFNPVSRLRLHLLKSCLQHVCMEQDVKCAEVCMACTAWTWSSQTLSQSRASEHMHNYNRACSTGKLLGHCMTICMLAASSCVSLQIGAGCTGLRLCAS